MLNSKRRKLTDLERPFLEPTTATHRQYEALRAYFIEQIPSPTAAAKFGYTPGSFRVLCHQFRQNPRRPFFPPDRDAARRTRPPKQPKPTSRLRERVVALRKQNFSIYDIVRALHESHDRLSAPAVWGILREEGFAKLPRRRD